MSPTESPGNCALPDFSQASRASAVTALLARGTQARVKTGFADLDPTGAIDPAQPVSLETTSQLTHVFALGAIGGDEQARAEATHGVNALRTYFHDDIHGCWYATIGATPDERGEASVVDATKLAAAHAAVMRAAAAAVVAGIEGADILLERARVAQDKRWWEAGTGKVRSRANRDFTNFAPHRSAADNLATVTACLAAFGATGISYLLDRALTITHWFAADQAGANGWQVPRHYDENWRTVSAASEAPVDQPATCGEASPGQDFAWSRLALQVGAAEAHRVGAPAPAWVAKSALALYDQAGGIPPGAEDEPTPTPMHNLADICEAINATQALLFAVAQPDLFPGLPQGEDLAQLQARLETNLNAWVGLLDTYLNCGPRQRQAESESGATPGSEDGLGSEAIWRPILTLLLPDLGLSPSWAQADTNQETRK